MRLEALFNASGLEAQAVGSGACEAMRAAAAAAKQAVAACDRSPDAMVVAFVSKVGP
jgi:hypothetical protein